MILGISWGTYLFGACVMVTFSLLGCVVIAAMIEDCEK